MQRKAKGKALENDQTAPLIAAESIREIRNHLKSINEGMIISEDGWKRFFRDENGFELMMGYFFEETPHLCTIDIDWVLPIPVRHNYKAIGIGASMPLPYSLDGARPEPARGGAYFFLPATCLAATACCFF